MPKGGKREGVGRPKGWGKFGLAEIRQVRVPLSRVHEVYSVLNKEPEKYSLPLYSSKVQAGFPSPADDYIERYLDLNAEFIKHLSATFLLKTVGDSMIDVGIFSGDTLVVDRSLELTDGKIVIAALNGELTVKRLSKKRKGTATSCQCKV